MLKRKAALLLVLTVTLSAFITGCGGKIEPEIEDAAEALPESKDVQGEEKTADASDEISKIDMIFDAAFAGEEIFEDDMKVLAENAMECDDCALFGQWNRTGCVMGLSGNISILSADGEILAEGDFDHYGNMGSIENGKGYLISDSKLFITDGYSDAVFFCMLKDDELYVKQQGLGSMGMSVTADGCYIKGEPEYTNANFISDLFSEENIKDQKLAAIKDLLASYSLDYKECFEDAINYGWVDYEEDTTGIFEDGSCVTGMYIYAQAPHGFTKNVEVYVSKDDNVYLKSWSNYEDTVVFATNDKEHAEMPSVDVMAHLAGTYIASYVEEYDGEAPRIFDNYLVINDDMSGVEIIQDYAEFAVSEDYFVYDGQKERYFLFNDAIAIGDPDLGDMRIYTKTSNALPKTVTDYKNTLIDEEYEASVSDKVKPGVYACKTFTEYDFNASDYIYADYLKVNSDGTAETFCQDVGPAFTDFKAGEVTDSYGNKRKVIVRNDSIALENTPEDKEFLGEYKVFTLTTCKYPE